MKLIQTMKKIKDIINKHNGIQINIFKYFAFFSIIILLVLWFFQIGGLKTFYRYQTIANIKKSADAIAKNLDNDNINLLIKRVAINNGLSIRLVSLNDKSLDISVENNSFSILLSRLNDTDIQNYYALTIKNNGEHTLIIEKSTFYNDEYDARLFVGTVPDARKGFDDHVVYSKVIYSKDKSYLFLGYTQLAPVEATTNILKYQFVLVSLMFIILSTLFTLFISNRITKPIVKINNAAKKLTSGNYDNDDQVGKYQEIKELNETLRYTAEELKQVDKLKNELIANISHDLRTPLTMISGYGEIMRDIPHELNKNNLDIIINETKRLSHLVDDILSLSQYQINAQALNIVEFSLTDEIDNTLKRYQVLYHDEYKFYFNHDSNLIISADQIKISQVIYNLLNNAINYSNDLHQIIINQIVNDSQVTIEISNYGKKISENDLVHVFERYYRSSENHIRAKAGSGLGLSIVKSIIELHNGKCFVESNDELTTFSFTLNIKQ
ncbi:MAG: HAMP domain-containing sensor histidine kinase [Erysipelotrichaceae bacterium]|nr:HAMP domain-containing sensor histidine kinase [Erysipelotrichaceae bacterium]